MVVGALGGGLAHGDVADGHGGAADLAAGDDGLQVRGGDGAVDAIAVQHVRDGGGHVVHGQIAVDDLLLHPGELDLGDALTGDQAPDAAGGLVLGVVLVALGALLRHFLVIHFDLTQIHDFSNSFASVF